MIHDDYDPTDALAAMSIWANSSHDSDTNEEDVEDMSPCEDELGDVERTEKIVDAFLKTLDLKDDLGHKRNTFYNMCFFVKMK